MKRISTIGIGITATMICAAVWSGCSSGDDSTSPPPDAGNDSTASSSSSGGGSSSSGAGSSSSSGAGSSSSSSSGGASDAGDGGAEAAPADGGSEAATDGGADAADAGPITWQQVYGDVISQHCVGCHAPPVGDAGPKGGIMFGHLDMGTVDAGYLNLINVPPQGSASPIVADAAVCNTLAADAGSDSGLMRVTPGNPGASLLFDKVNGYVTAPPCGAPMPPTVATFTEIPDGGQAAAALEIQQWIAAGAHP